MSNLLEERAVLVTGAARGIGAAICRAMIEEGAHVLLGDVRADLGRAVAAELGDRADFVPLDVRDERAWEHAVARAIERFGKLDVLVNNAGIIQLADLERTDARDFMDVIEVNTLGAFLGMRAALPGMKARRSGSIVNISSTAAMTGANRTIAYTASKWAIRGMTKVAAAEAGEFGIRVNSVHPGPTETDMNPVDPAKDHDWRDQYPLNRIGQPADVANVVVFLASERSAYCTGSEFVVDGGRSSCTLVREFAGEGG